MRVGPGHALQHLGLGVWGNGHLRFVPEWRHRKLAWNILLAGVPHTAKPVAHIRWHPTWKEYVLYTRDGHIFAIDCLADIRKFIVYANNLQRRLAHTKSAVGQDGHQPGPQARVPAPCHDCP